MLDCVAKFLVAQPRLVSVPKLRINTIHPQILQGNIIELQSFLHHLSKLKRLKVLYVVVVPFQTIANLRPYQS